MVPLSTGTRLGPYEVLSLIGAGGMGEVYRARDTRLLREVAIKVLPAESSHDHELLLRFEQEARSASSLNHPNVVTIHDIGRTDAVSYIAMEVVEGRTLRSALADGPLPMDRLITLAAQVADGLAAAHDKDIVHRDLKPENIMVMGGDRAKILDFGLARVEPPAAADASTVLDMRTRPGTVMGTLAYMSPEQVCGQRADVRSDQFSFCAILYEMATARHAFTRATSAETIAAILREDPDPVATINPAVPAALVRIIGRGLAKRPEDRYESTRDLAKDLADLRDRVGHEPGRPGLPRASAVPLCRARLIGRAAEIEAAQELLLREEVRLVTLTGPGGTGKSCLALQMADSVASRFPSGVFFVPLAPISDPTLVVSTVAQVLGVRAIPGVALEQSLREAVHHAAHSPMLLVLDNFEHLVAAAALVGELLAVAPRLKILTTSRAALRIYGEHEFPVPPLAFPDPKAALPELATLRTYPAIALFQDRAQAVKPDFVLTEANAPAVVEICARLDGLPLAIELAVARIKLLPPEAILARLQSRLRLLTGGSRDVAVRQQTLRGAIDWSYELLSPTEQKLFTRLGVFVGGCSLEAAEAVCGAMDDLDLDILDGLGTLVNQSLLEQVPTGDDQPRFRLLETIREYALERLSRSPEAATIRQAHAAYFVLLAEDGDARFGGPDEPQWLERFDAEHDNFRAALDGLQAAGRGAWSLRIAVGLWRYWEMREHLSEGRRRLLAALDLAGERAPAELRASALFGAAVLTGARGEFDQASELHRAHTALVRPQGDPRSLAIAVNALAVNSLKRGELAAARSLFEECLHLWRTLGDRKAVSRALSNLASVVKVQDGYRAARALYEESLAESLALGDQSVAAVTLGNLGDLAREQGDATTAREFYERSLGAFQQIGDPWGLAGALADMGRLAREYGDAVSARARYMESLTLFEGLGHRRGIARLLEELACSAASQSDWRGALRLAGAASALRDTIGAAPTSAEQSALDRALEPARTGLGAGESASALKEGRAMPLERALAYARQPAPA